jgi:hypothetical protein
MTIPKPLEPLFDQMAEWGDRYFDPSESLIEQLHPGAVYAPVHTRHLKSETGHLTRDSLQYAMVLLARNGEGDAARAKDILHRCFELQGRRPGDSRDGLWHYVAEESVFDWPFPDFNWADFNGLTLLTIWHLAGGLLDDETREGIREALRRAAGCIRTRNVDLRYTNIAVKGTFVTLATAELLGDDELLAYATDRMKRLHAEIFRTASFTEYNSPVYAAISIAGLASIDMFVRDEPSKDLAREIQHLFWRHIANHFHVPTRELAGPHSRAYAARLHDFSYFLGTLLCRATGGEIRYGLSERDLPFHAYYGVFLEPDLPDDALRLLRDTGRTDFVVERTDPRDQISAWWRPMLPPDTRDPKRKIDGIPAVISTLLCPEFCLGTVNLMDGWDQRHNLIAYWNGGGEKPSYLRHRYLHDECPCCSGCFASRQENSTALAAAFLAEYADEHVSFPASEIEAEFLGPVLEIENEGQQIEAYLGDVRLSPSGEPVIWPVGEALCLRLPTVWIGFHLIGHRSSLSEEKPSISFNGDRLEARFPHYHGEKKTLRWTDFSEAHTLYGLSMSAPGTDWDAWRAAFAAVDHEVRRDGDRIQVSRGGLRMTLPATVVPRENLPDLVKIG